MASNFLSLAARSVIMGYHPNDWDSIPRSSTDFYPCHYVTKKIGFEKSLVV
jgi:hypothetical protein